LAGFQVTTIGRFWVTAEDLEKFNNDPKQAKAFNPIAAFYRRGYATDWRLESAQLQC
jgi:hypothetical protein